MVIFHCYVSSPEGNIILPGDFLGVSYSFLGQVCMVCHELVCIFGTSSMLQAGEIQGEDGVARAYRPSWNGRCLWQWVKKTSESSSWSWAIYNFALQVMWFPCVFFCLVGLEQSPRCVLRAVVPLTSALRSLLLCRCLPWVFHEDGACLGGTPPCWSPAGAATVHASECGPGAHLGGTRWDLTWWKPCSEWSVSNLGPASDSLDFSWMAVSSTTNWTSFLEHNSSVPYRSEVSCLWQPWGFFSM